MKMSLLDQDEIVDLLLRNGADVNRVDYYGRSSLYMAARNGKCSNI